MHWLHIISPPILHSPIALCYVCIYIYIYLAFKFGFGLLEMKIERERKSEGEGKTYLKGERFGCWIRSKQGVRLNLINYLVGFIPCQICLYFSN